jgi:hypothetical protein
MIPIKATVEDLDKLLAYLRTSFGWVALAKVKATLDSKTTDNRKLDAAKYIGLINRDGQNIEITDDGRAYASAKDDNEKHAIMAKQLATSELYLETVSWMFHAPKSNPTKTDVGEQWHKHHTDLLGGAAGAALGDGVLFFMRVAEAAGLGKFITAGKGRPETYFKDDRAAIEDFAAKYILGGGVPEAAVEPQKAIASLPAVSATAASGTAAAPSFAPATAPTVSVQASPAVHINVEIHIAADATAETVAEIFKNMRRYVLNNPAEVTEDAD